MFYWTRYDLKEKIMLITAAAIACLLFFCISMTSQVNASEQNNAPGLNTASVCSIENTTKGILLEWKKAPGANGYRIFRKEEGFSEWQHIKTISSGNILMWKDKKDMTSGTLYKYLILSGKTGSEDLSADPANGAADENAVSFHFVRPVRLTSHKCMANNMVDDVWERQESADGYELQFSASPFFTAAESVFISGNENIHYNGQPGKNGKYARVRAYKINGDIKDFSSWSYSAAFRKKIKLTVKYNKRKGKKTDYRKMSRQKLYGYDVFQGACSYGKYSYHSLLNKNNGRFKLVRVNMDSGKVVKTGTRAIRGHANSMTYNTDDRIAVATQGNGSNNKLTIINIKSLNPKRVVKIKVPAAVSGAGKADIKKIRKGITAISYEESRKKYVARVADLDDFIVMNRNFTVIRYVKVSKKFKQMRQSMLCTKDMVICLMSPVSSKQDNIGVIYDWNGNYITKVWLGKKYELEDVYFNEGVLYGHKYNSFLKTIKKKKVVRVIVKKKSKKTGKIRYKLVKKKKTVKKKIFYRENYIFKAY